MARIKWHLKQVFIAFDQMLNAALGGWADETFSARCYRRRGNKVWRGLGRVVDFIFFWEKGHCRQSYESELERLHIPPETREIREA